MYIYLFSILKIGVNWDPAIPMVQNYFWSGWTKSEASSNQISSNFSLMWIVNLLYLKFQ